MVRVDQYEEGLEIFLFSAETASDRGGGGEQGAIVIEDWSPLQQAILFLCSFLFDCSQIKAYETIESVFRAAAIKHGSPQLKHVK